MIKTRYFLYVCLGLIIFIVCLFSEVKSQMKGLEKKTERSLLIPWKMTTNLDVNNEIKYTEIIYLGGNIAMDKDGWTTASTGLLERTPSPKYSIFKGDEGAAQIGIIPIHISKCNRFNMCKAKEGRCNFEKPYKIILDSGIILRIVWQDDRMAIEKQGWGKNEGILHYGLSVSSNSLDEARTYLKKFLGESSKAKNEKVTLNYQPEQDILIAIIGFPSEPYFKPIIDYQMDRQSEIKK